MPVKQPRIRVNVICPNGDQLLLVRHQKGERTYWLLPGGGLEFGESFADCAVREMREETGLEVEAVRPVWLSESIDPAGSRHIVNVYLLVRVVGGEVQQGLDEGVVEVAYKPVAELTGLTLYPPVADRLVSLHAGDYAGPLTFLGQMWA